MELVPVLDVVDVDELANVVIEERTPFLLQCETRKEKSMRLHGEACIERSFFDVSAFGVFQNTNQATRPR